MKRLLRSLWISPLAAFPVTLCVFAVWSLGRQLVKGNPMGVMEILKELGFSLLCGVGALWVAFPAMLVLGIPTILGLWKFTSFRLPVLRLAGGLVGGLAALIVLYLSTEDFRWVGTAPSLVAGVLSGVAIAEQVGKKAGPHTSHDKLQPTPTSHGGTAMLTVLYDGRCALCRRARAWLDDQPKYVPLDYVVAGSPEARRRFPGLDHDNTLVDLTVVGMNGEVYHGAKAWIMCLWALKKYRGTALRLATPELMPSARRIIAWVSRNRFRVGTTPAWKT
ncbi:MAG TPA: DCC1-like thiol-disulfide oxidoreductase family protein [Thermoanaerobaculia bacterium]|nr:DCC1-like thiol-disulfide oxidoreductase family protein [Thermoanaerobaculia bacterium]